MFSSGNNMFGTNNLFYFYLLCFLLISNCVTFTIEELKAINFEVDLSQTPMKKGEEQSVPVVLMTSIYGQEYQCMLENIEEESSEKVLLGEKNTDIKELLKPLHTGKCLLKTKDWWTYELCFGRHIKQFHIEEGKIVGQVLTLGLYESDYDWDKETDEEKYKHSKQRYHAQYFVNGTKCDLTGQPRTAEVRIFCEEGSGDYVHRVDEPGTCNYVITVHTSSVCAHPQLKPLPSKKTNTIPCHPLLNEEQYSIYLKKLNEEKALADQKRNQFLNTQQEKLEVLKRENLEKDSQKLEDLIENPSGSVLDDSFVSEPAKGKEQAEENKVKTEEEGELLTFKEYDKELDKLKAFLTPEKFAAVKQSMIEFFHAVTKNDKTELSKDDKNYAYVKLTLQLNKLLQDLNKAKKEVVDATENLNEAKAAISKFTTNGESDNSKPSGEEEYEKFTSALNELLKKLYQAEKDVVDATKKLNKAKAAIFKSTVDGETEKDNENADSLLDKKEAKDNDELQVKIRRLDLVNSNGKVYEINEDEQKKLAQAVKEKLEKYEIDTRGRTVEVKIFKPGYYGSHLTDTQASHFEDLITALMTGDLEALQEMERNKKLEENYKYTWSNKEVDETNDEESK